MKKQTYLVSIALLAAPLFAQGTQQWIGVQGGYDWQGTDSRNAKDNGIFGLTYGSWCTDRWGGDLSILGTQLKDKTTGKTSDEYHGHLSALLNLAPQRGKYIPYLRAGLGGSNIQSPFSQSGSTTTRFSYHGGVGVMAFPSEHFLVGLEGRAIRIETRNSANEYVGLVTLAYTWGSTPPPPPPPPAAAPAPEPPPAPAPAPEPAPAAEPPAPAPAPAVEAPAPAPEPAPAPPKKIVLDEALLHFANGKAVVPADGVGAIRKVADSLKEFQGAYTLKVTGYTSSVGSAALNRRLSKQRAEAVAKVLVDSGVPAASIQTEGRGPADPVADNKTKAGQAKNRRVEIEIQAAGVETHTVETQPTE